MQKIEEDNGLLRANVTVKLKRALAALATKNKRTLSAELILAIEEHLATAQKSAKQTA